MAGLYLESMTNAFIWKRIFTYLYLYVHDEGMNEKLSKENIQSQILKEYVHLYNENKNR